MADKAIPSSPNYLYIDSKTIGTFTILASYFESQVFLKEDCLVIVKYYKEADAGIRYLKQKGIPVHRIKTLTKLDSLESGNVFYLFNAQSNCRFVANRNLKHIFVTHGESNKLSSIKPICRIYDYIITSGDIGTNRFLDSGILSQWDLANRVFKMGDTFIGQSPYYYYSDEGDLLYAPTWEGGVPKEDYSSVSNKKVYLFLGKIAQERKIIIQPHPSTGHRSKKILNDLYDGIEYLLSVGHSVVLTKKRKGWREYLLSLKGVQFIENKSMPISHGIVDVSAMEFELMTRKIPFNVILKASHPPVDAKQRLTKHYQEIGIDLISVSEINPTRVNTEEFISYSFPEMGLMKKNDRIKFLVERLT